MKSDHKLPQNSESPMTEYISFLKEALWLMEEFFITGCKQNVFHYQEKRDSVFGEEASYCKSECLTYIC